MKMYEEGIRVRRNEIEIKTNRNKGWKRMEEIVLKPKNIEIREWMQNRETIYIERLANKVDEKVRKFGNQTPDFAEEKKKQKQKELRASSVR